MGELAIVCEESAGSGAVVMMTGWLRAILVIGVCALTDSMCSAGGYDAANVRINFQANDQAEARAPKGVLPVGTDLYDASKGYGWFGVTKGAGWRLKGLYGGGADDRAILFSSSVQNVHAPIDQCSGFRVDVPNGEYLLEMGFSGGELYGTSWDIHVVGRRVSRGTIGPKQQKTFKMNVYVTDGFFAFGMSRSGVCYLNLTRLSSTLPALMASKEINDFSPRELVSDADWRTYYRKHRSDDVPMDWASLRRDVQAGERAEKVRLQSEPVQYWSDVPLAMKWGDAGKNVTVRRRLPVEPSLLEEATFRVKFSQKASGRVSMILAGEPVSVKLDPSGYEASVCVRDAGLLKVLASKARGFDVTITCDSGSIGKYVYDSAVSVPWIPNGEDGEHFIAGVTVKAVFRSRAEAYAVSRVAMDAYVPRTVREPVVEHVRGESVANADGSLVRVEMCLNGEWEFQTTSMRGLRGLASEAPTAGWQVLRVPGVWSGVRRKIDWPSDSHDRREWLNSPCGWYRLKFVAPKLGDDRRAILEFGMVNYYAAASLNGEFLGEHRGIYTPFEVDVSRSLRWGQENTLLVYVEDEGRDDGGVKSFVKKQKRDLGILRDVYLHIRPTVYVEQCRITPSVRKHSLTVSTAIRNADTIARAVQLSHGVRDGDKQIVSLPAQTIQLMPGERRECVVSAPWSDPILWDIDRPKLYFLRSQVIGADSAILDQCFSRFGFRELWIDGTELKFNGRTFYLQGDSIVDYFQAYAIPHIRTAIVAARSANRNILRVHQAGPCQPIPEIADELGMLIMPENDGGLDPSRIPLDSATQKPIPGWEGEIHENLADFYRRTWNHPSIVVQSMDNELQLQGTPRTWLADVLVDCERYAKTIDDSRIYTHEGDFWLKDDATDTINMHYVPLSWVSSWREKYRRPLLLGEVNGDPSPMNRAFESGDVAGWWASARALASTLESQIRAYIELDVPGVHPFELAGYTRCLISHPGPWGNLREDVRAPSATLSGPGIKLFRLTRTPFMGKYNWFDPARPMMTPEIVFNTTRDTLRPMPYISGQVSPEIVIRVRPGENVLLYPCEQQNSVPMISLADSQGYAGFRVKQGGRYRAVVDRGGQAISVIVIPEPPGEWWQVKTVIVD